MARSKYMTKAEALAEFRELYIPELNKQYGKDDVIARRTAWNDYTDYLRTDDRISEKAYENWTNPF